MSANHRTYEDHLEYLPEKERKAMKEALFIEKEIENTAESVIRQINRSKTVEQKALKRA
ncbi:MAG: mRNA-degrading endonuclease RelE of RelBE toxin-antitoxin system [Candidatus Nanohaloarchaea archaeon]|jgi:mRNA-degrading endonuclease RelE of RelBE toxin-antitoxin system